MIYMEHHLAEQGASLCLLCGKPWPCYGYTKDLERALADAIHRMAFDADFIGRHATRELDAARAVLQRGRPES